MISSAAFTLLPRVEVVVPTGKVTTIQIEDTYLIANLHFTDPVTITFKSYIVDLFIFSSANVTLNGTLSSLGLIVDAPSTIFDGYFLFDNLTAGIKSASGNNNTGFVLDFKICGAEPNFCNLKLEFCTPDIDLYNPWYGCQGSSQIFNHTRVFTYFDANSAIETMNVGNTFQYNEITTIIGTTVKVPSTSCTLMEFLDADGSGNNHITSSGLWTISFFLTVILVLQ